MKYGILGDIHANLSALQAVFARMDAIGVDAYVSVGDVVGYGAAPGECIAILQERGVHTVLGNHDAACADLLDDMHFNPYARAAVAWTRGALDAREIGWLRELPLHLTLDHCEVSHGTIHRPELFDYLLSVTDADPSLDIIERPVGFVGHSHIPLSVMRFADVPDQTAYSFDAQIDLSSTSKAIVNAGSVGQPRDEDPRAAFVVYDAETRQVEILRTEYDIDLEADRIRAAGLPDVLAERLKLGV